MRRRGGGGVPGRSGPCRGRAQPCPPCSRGRQWRFHSFEGGSNHSDAGNGLNGPGYVNILSGEYAPGSNIGSADYFEAHHLAVDVVRFYHLEIYLTVQLKMYHWLIHLLTRMDWLNTVGTWMNNVSKCSNEWPAICWARILNHASHIRLTVTWVSTWGWTELDLSGIPRLASIYSLQVWCRQEDISSYLLVHLHGCLRYLKKLCTYLMSLGRSRTNDPFITSITPNTVYSVWKAFVGRYGAETPAQITGDIGVLTPLRH